MTYRDKLIAIAIAVWFLLLCAFIASASAHETQILNCGGYERAVKVGEGTVENGMLAEEYDTDGDGKADLITLSSVTGTDDKTTLHQPFPTFYWVDRDGDGKVDYVYIDKNGDGFCESIVLYVDRSRNTIPELKKEIVN